MPTLALSNQRVAIFEDDVTNRGRWTSMVNLCGGTPLPVADHAPSLKNLKAFFKTEKVTMLMCDHHLFEQGDYAGYYGAEAVAASYRSGIAGILVTAFERDDAELSLRKYRRWIPALINSPKLTLNNLSEALLQADREVRHQAPIRERVPHRTIMTVRRIENRGTHKIVKVMMSQWNAAVEVGFPLEMVPEKLKPAVAPGALLIAQVNIEATRAEDLYFDKFELPDADVLKKAKTILGHP